MTERPILFSGPMVRAIRYGRKTQTRRPLKPQPQPAVSGWDWGWKAPGKSLGEYLWTSNGHPGSAINYECPYGQPGDRLWVRETWALVPATAYTLSDGVYQTTDPKDEATAAVYRCGWERCRPGRWRPSIHMPRWASRITLEVTGVRVERVQDISEADAEAEACWRTPEGRGHYSVEPPEFRILWDAINANRGAGWDANPWVWVVEFRRSQQ